VILHKRPMAERFRRKQDVVKEVVWLIEQEAGAYQDPITQFLQCLYVRFDFDGAQEQLQACYAVLRNDYFLSGWADAFLSEARQLIFETYCRIHRKIDINMLGQKLGACLCLLLLLLLLVWCLVVLGGMGAGWDGMGWGRMELCWLVVSVLPSLPTPLAQPTRPLSLTLTTPKNRQLNLLHSFHPNPPGMSPAEAEKWIVDLILDSKLVAKIDSRENYVEMDAQSPSIYQQVRVWWCGRSWLVGLGRGACAFSLPLLIPRARIRDKQNHA
jgi:hypothetical protein